MNFITLIIIFYFYFNQLFIYYFNFYYLQILFFLLLISYISLINYSDQIYCNYFLFKTNLIFNLKNNKKSFFFFSFFGKSLMEQDKTKNALPTFEEARVNFHNYPHLTTNYDNYQKELVQQTVVANLNQTNQNLISQIAPLNLQNTNLNLQNTSLIQSNISLNLQNQTLTQKTKDYYQQNLDLTNSISKLKKLNKKSNLENSNLEQQKSKLLQDKMNEIEQLIDEKQSLSFKIQCLEGKINFNSFQKKKLSDEIEALKQQIENLNSQITNLGQNNLIAENNNLIGFLEKAVHHGAESKKIYQTLFNNDFKFFQYIQKILKKNNYEQFDLFLEYKKIYFKPPIRNATSEQFQEYLENQTEIMDAVIFMLTQCTS